MFRTLGFKTPSRNDTWNYNDRHRDAVRERPRGGDATDNIAYLHESFLEARHFRIKTFDFFRGDEMTDLRAQHREMYGGGGGFTSRESRGQ